MSVCALYDCVWFVSYEDPEVALTCGVMLRESVKHEPLAKLVLESPEFFTFFRYVEVSTFDIASDAFSTFKVLALVSVLLLFIFLSYCFTGATHKTQAALCWIS